MSTIPHQGRGQVSPRIEKRSQELLGYVIGTKELRLMPYIQYEMVNNQRIEIHKIDPEERKILSKWKEAGHMEGGASGLAITQDFWNIINELIFLGYVDLHE